MLTTPSVEGLQKLLAVCEEALVAIDMQVNVNALWFGVSCTALTLLTTENSGQLLIPRRLFGLRSVI